MRGFTISGATLFPQGRALSKRSGAPPIQNNPLFNKKSFSPCHPQGIWRPAGFGDPLLLKKKRQTTDSRLPLSGMTTKGKGCDKNKAVVLNWRPAGLAGPTCLCCHPGRSLSGISRYTKRACADNSASPSKTSCTTN